MGLRGRTVVLTGASGGIGAALVAGLVDAGATVLAVGRDPVKLNTMVHRHRPGAVVPVTADLGTPEGRAAVVARAASMSPSLLVIAHAQGAFGLFEEQSDADIARLLQTNLVAPMLLIRALLPWLQKQPEAAVVAVGSTFGALAFPGFAAYSASKFGLRGLIEALGREYAEGPVRFQYLSPRATRTAFNTAAVDALNAELKTAQDEPADVAQQLIACIRRGDRRRQLGWPEKFFARLNGAFPALIDRALRAQLPTVRRHARAASPAPTGETA
ncbi:MAG: SDR family oxidoreductase [Arenimonas sp.]|uniref:SDR family oxidoreductase n=1 Tax=Arenimonas sp. TaxID=1872635 RepID=UPI0025C2B741|nr:SDR family oxidoreductase [Arenimonas sp.]MBW8368226.1 SDR family oxidoreductase [Arenimonas sp.]